MFTPSATIRVTHDPVFYLTVFGGIFNAISNDYCGVGQLGPLNTSSLLSFVTRRLTHAILHILVALAVCIGVNLGE